MNIKWTVEEKEFIRENAGFMKDKELAQRLTDKSGRSVTVDALRKVRQKLGIKKKHGRGICALVYSPVEEDKRENKGDPSQAVSNQSG
jgi:transposase